MAPRKDTDRNGSDVSTSQRMSRADSNRGGVWEETGKDPPLEPSEGARTCQRLVFELLDFGTARE